MIIWTVRRRRMVQALLALGSKPPAPEPPAPEPPPPPAASASQDNALLVDGEDQARPLSTSIVDRQRERDAGNAVAAERLPAALFRRAVLNVLRDRDLGLAVRAELAHLLRVERYRDNPGHTP